MKNSKLKYLTDEDMLEKFDVVERERMECLKGKFAPYLSRTALPLLDPKTAA